MDKNIIIYGAGDYGKRLFSFFSALNIKIDFFCETQVEENEKYLYDIPVISLHELRKQENIKCVLIAICDENISALIKRQLQNLLSVDDEIFECGDFIKKNLSAEKHRKCNICGSKIKTFLSGGEDNNLFKLHHIIGGGVRENCTCPICGSRDRERWCLDVLKNYTHILDSCCRILHFAPERGIAERIRANQLADYYCGDISKSGTINQVDVTNICQYKDETFDYVIINHVLEHVVDLSGALSELKRVIKKDGKIIMSFPICTDMQTIEQMKEMTDEERTFCFGQRDHVRLFGLDFKEILEAHGFKVSVKSPKDKYSYEQIKYYGFIEDDIVLICKK